MPAITKEQLGQAVRTYRLARGYRQEDLAALMGYSRSAYSNRENGTTWFHVNDLLTLADLFGVPVSALLTTSVSKKPPCKIRRLRYNKTI